MSSRLHPELFKPVAAWLPANQGFYARFRTWLRDGGYGESALNQYSVAVRLAISILDKPYWLIDAGADLDQVRQVITATYESQATCGAYNKGLLKLAEFLRRTNGQAPSEKPVNWAYFLDGLPHWLAADVRGYMRHRQRAWRPEEQHHLTANNLGRLTPFLRWSARHTELTSIAELTPALWFDYLDARLAAGITPKTTNGELSTVQSFLLYLAELEQPICHRFLRLRRLSESRCLPRDVPVEQLRQVYAAIEAAVNSSRSDVRRMAVMDRAWFLLMLHSGLRTGEVRRLCRSDLDLTGRRLRIEQSKGLKDRLVFLSAATVEAVEAYLPCRGPVVSDHLFAFRHQPLSYTYCIERLRTYGKACGLTLTPHQLRHSCATLLLNAGAPILTVQALLGHRHIDTTLSYARLYDGTIAADYYRAMSTVEQRLQLAPVPEQPRLDAGRLVALVDALGSGALNQEQRDVVAALRNGILALAEQQDGGRTVDSGVMLA
jgi:integrase